MFFQQEQEEIKIIPMQPIICAICGHTTWFFINTDEQLYSEKCSFCNCWLISNLLNHETWEQNIEDFKREQI